MNPTLQADLDTLDELYGGLLDLLRGLDDDALNWSPAVPETNSIAVLTAHMVGSNARWLSRATGNQVPTDRAAEFRTRTTRSEAIALVERARVDARGWLAALDSVDPAAPRQSEPGQVVSSAWCVQHALIHSGEHWGQIQLTRQLHAAAR